MGRIIQASFLDVGSMSAAADYMAPGALETNRYQTEITDRVRRRFAFGQRINNTPATGQPSRYFEQLSIPGAGFTDPRAITVTASGPSRTERVLMLKAITSQINYGIFDVEINQQQNQFAYLEAKDLTDTVDGVLKLHDQNLWNGNDTDLLLNSTNQYYGVSGQIINAQAGPFGFGALPAAGTIAATGSIVNAISTAVASGAARTDFEPNYSAIYLNPMFSNMLNIEAKSLQLFFNEVEILPGVIVKELPTDMGLLPIVADPAITNLANGSLTQYTGFIISEEMIEYHYVTDPLPRVFQLGLQGNLAAQYVVVKFGAVVAKGAGYAHIPFTTLR